ncbi:MAG: MarC family protein [Salibacteraceae bacterium]
MNIKEILSVTLILFSVIDIIGSIPIVIDLRKKEGKIHSAKATVVAGLLMIIFLFVGSSILNLFGLDEESFAIAGAIIMFFISFEMILGITLFKSESNEKGIGSIVPLAFPLIAGAGTLTTILSLKAVYTTENLLVGIILNLIIVFTVLKSTDWLEKIIGAGGFLILRRVFGIILLAIAVKIFKENMLMAFGEFASQLN